MNPRAARRQATSKKDHRATKQRIMSPAERHARAICASKHRHPDELTARAGAAAHLAKNPDVPELYVYRCPECNGWHLTKRPHGIPVTAADPVAEQPAMQQLLGQIMRGKLASYFDCAHGDTRDQAWIHAACLELERRGLVRRYKTHATSIIWIDQAAA